MSFVIKKFLNQLKEVFVNMKTTNSLPRQPKMRTRQLTLIGLMTAVICILGPLSLPLPFSPVPITLTNLAVFFAIYLLGIKGGTVCLLVYLCLGTAGLPVFSSFSGGLGKLAGPTGGYLIGFIFLALIQGFLMKAFPGKNTAAVIGMILGMAVCYLFGTAWLAIQMGLTFPAALSIGVLPYLPGDGVKIVIAAIAGPKLRSAVQRATHDSI